LKLLLVTDAWKPQVNGVVRSYLNTIPELEKMGMKVEVIHPELFKLRFALPSYNEIKVVITRKKTLKNMIDQINPDHIHIATEGPLGFLARKICLTEKKAFSTSFHTRFPEYIQQRTKIPASFFYFFIKHFHNKAKKVLVPTPSMQAELIKMKFKNTVVWSRGVNHEKFGHYQKLDLGPGPIFSYIGRVATEKNIQAFLDLDLDGTKVVVGDGPQLNKLKKKYTDVKFVGYQFGQDLVNYYASSDVMVFPSKTDTFGNVVTEANATGTPVAAYDVTGPKDIIVNGINGFIGDNLKENVMNCLNIDRKKCQEYTKKFNWHECSKVFYDNIVA